MENESTNFLYDNIQRLLNINPIVYLFVTGKYASGKSTTTNQIKERFSEYGVYSLEFDEVIRKHVIDKSNNNLAEATFNAFKVYKNKGTIDETNIFIDYTKKYIEENTIESKRLIILEGALSSKEILEKIIDNKIIYIVYFQPIDFELHKKRIIFRIKSDIINDTYSLPGYWCENGLFNRIEMKDDIINNINIEKKYEIQLIDIVKKYMEDAHNRCNLIQIEFTNEKWSFYVQYT